jgi:enolase
MDIFSQHMRDAALITLDGTEDKSRLGANALLGVSLACARAAALARGIPLYRYLHQLGGIKKSHPGLPRPMFNLINGGLHADSGLDIQEYLFVPLKVSMAEAVRMAAETYHQLASILKERTLSSGVGDEGGFAPRLSSDGEGFELIHQAAEKAGYTSGRDYDLAFDGAANSFLHSSQPFTYNLSREHTMLTAEQLVGVYEEWADRYGIISIEDGLAEDDKEGWQMMTKRIGDKTHVVGQTIEVVGDDLFVTNARRLVDGANDKLGTAVIIKPNQVGTVTETITTIKRAKQLRYACIASHRSGETNDDFIADLAVGLACDYIKAGAPARGERVAKYNRLMNIEQELNVQFR